MAMAPIVPAFLIPTRRRVVRGVLWAALLAILPGRARPATEMPVSEWDLKAAFLPKFPLFVEWPAGTFRGSGDPLVIGVLGDSEAIPHLEQAVAGKIVAGRALRLVRCREPAEARRCQIVFLAVTDLRAAGDLLRQLDGCRALTVSDVPNFASEGGMVNLVSENKRIRLEVNVEAVRRAELRMAPQLLQVAKPVKTTGKGGS